jgi:hypothetical protein
MQRGVDQFGDALVVDRARLAGCNSSCRPLTRASRKRRCHLHTAALVSCVRSAILLLAWPSAEGQHDARAHHHRGAESERERAIEVSWACFPSLSASSAFGRPIGISVSPLGKIPKFDAMVMPLSNGTER